MEFYYKLFFANFLRRKTTMNIDYIGNDVAQKY